MPIVVRCCFAAAGWGFVLFVAAGFWSTLTGSGEARLLASCFLLAGFFWGAIGLVVLMVSLLRVEKELAAAMAAAERLAPSRQPATGNGQPRTLRSFVPRVVDSEAEKSARETAAALHRARLQHPSTEWLAGLRKGGAL